MPKFGSRGKEAAAAGTTPQSHAQKQPALSSLTDDFIDYALAAESGRTPPTCPRPNVQQPKRSALDLLKWNSTALDNKPAAAQRAVKRAKKEDDPAQLFIDAGQRDFTSKTCKVCGMVFCPGLSSEEELHRRFHRETVEGIEWRGFKDERVITRFPDGARIVRVCASDPAGPAARADLVRERVEAQLGAVDFGAAARRPGSSSYVLIFGGAPCRWIPPDGADPPRLAHCCPEHVQQRGPHGGS